MYNHCFFGPIRVYGNNLNNDVTLKNGISIVLKAGQNEVRA